MKKFAKWIWKNREGKHFSDEHKYALAIHKLEKSWPFQVFAIGAAIGGLVVLIWTLVSIRDDLAFRQQERENWRLDRIDRAWNRVLRPATGTTGKGNALSYLFNEGQHFHSLDLSCKTMGGWKNGKCVKAVTIFKFKMNRDVTKMSALERNIVKSGVMPLFETEIDLSDAILIDFEASNVSVGLRLDNATLFMAKIIDSSVDIRNEREATFSSVDLSNSKIHLGGEAKFFGSNFSNTNLTGFRPNLGEGNNGNWFWAGTPPLCFDNDVDAEIGIKHPPLPPEENLVVDTQIARAQKVPCSFIKDPAFSICAVLTTEQKSTLKKHQQEVAVDKNIGFRCPFYVPMTIAEIRNSQRIVLTLDQAKLLYPQIYK